ncbi:MAG TPA: pyridoxal-dependent decarboxylase [Steroidobacteraceae bacterium]|nr:pyridoxal-dependent decarboxylase [Steroidobacteraceae bacterium]
MELLEDAARRASKFLASLDSRPVRADPEAAARLDELLTPAPRQATPDREVLAHLDEYFSPATMATAGPRFFGFVIGGSLPATVAANWLATAWDQNTCYDGPTPGVARVEEIARRWLLEVLDLPRDSAVGFVTGATVANFTALAASRNAVLRRSGWNVEADGLFGAPPIRVVVGEESHPTLLKSLGMLGLGRNRLTRVPVDAQGRMRPDKLPTLDGPTILCLQAGNVNSGAFDAFPELCAAGREAGAWIHVDGAFGLWARASSALAPLARGLELADSWATDAHKWLNVPYDSGLAFVRDAQALQSAMAITAEYLPTQGARRNPSDFTPELSRRARGIEVYAALKNLGSEGLEKMIDRNCAQARRFAAGLEAAGFEILNDVVLNQVVVSFGDPERTRRVVDAIQREGTCWAGGTVWQGRTGMRISVSSWATTDADVDRSLDAMLRCARECA